jgi:hypothetical protein
MTLIMSMMVINKHQKNNFYKMKNLHLKKWYNNPKLKVFLIVAVVIKIIIVVIITTL